MDFCLGDGQCPLLVDLGPDFDVLMSTPSAFLQMDDIQQTVDSVEREMAPVRVLVKRAKELAPGARDRVLALSRENEGKIELLKSEMEAARKQFSEMCSYLSYSIDDSKGETSATPFLHIQGFVRDVKWAVDAHLRRQKAEKAAAKKKAKAEKKRKMKEASKLGKATTESEADAASSGGPEAEA